MALPEGIERVKREKELREAMTACRGVLAMFVLDAPPNMKGTEDDGRTTGGDGRTGAEAGHVRASEGGNQRNDVRAPSREDDAGGNGEPVNAHPREDDRTVGEVRSGVAHQEGEASPSDTMTELERLIDRLHYCEKETDPNMVNSEAATAEGLFDEIRSMVERLERENEALLQSRSEWVRDSGRTQERLIERVHKAEAQLSTANERLKECQKCLQDACRATISTCPKCGKEDAHLSVSSSSICRRCEKSTAIRKAVIEELKRADKHMLDSEDWDDHGYLIGRITQLEEEDGTPKTSTCEDRQLVGGENVAPTGYEGASLDELLTVPLSLRQANSFLTELRRRLEAGEAAQRELKDGSTRHGYSYWWEATQ